MNKNILRKKFINLPHNIANDHLIIDNALSIIEKFNPKIIGIYIAYEHETDLSGLMLKCADKRFAVPKIKGEGDNIFFVNYSSSSNLQLNEKYTKYHEPVSNTVVFPDLIFIPALAFDIKGHRLGRGRGHYDKYLSSNSAVKIGVGISGRLVERLPAENHDIRMDYIITDDHIMSILPIL